MYGIPRQAVLMNAARFHYQSLTSNGDQHVQCVLHVPCGAFVSCQQALCPSVLFSIEDII